MSDYSTQINLLFGFQVLEYPKEASVLGCYQSTVTRPQTMREGSRETITCGKARCERCNIREEKKSSREERAAETDRVKAKKPRRRWRPQGVVPRSSSPIPPSASQCSRYCNRTRRNAIRAHKLLICLSSTAPCIYNCSARIWNVLQVCFHTIEGLALGHERTNAQPLRAGYWPLWIDNGGY